MKKPDWGKIIVTESIQNGQVVSSKTIYESSVQFDGDTAARAWFSTLLEQMKGTQGSQLVKAELLFREGKIHRISCQQEE